jgi:type IV pilus assembly protein PilY1
MPSSVAKPNVIFGLDDSGSMDFEVMINSNDGALWWNDTTVTNGQTGTGWDATGSPLFNATGNSGGGWTKYGYLFPNGCSGATKINCDSSGHYAIPPTYQFASLRSSSYNPLYYNPAVTYQPWTPAYIASATKTFAASPPTLAPSHPLFTAIADLTLLTLATATDTTFMARPGMVVTAGSKIFKSKAWLAQAATTTLGSGISYNTAYSFYPATYWTPAKCTVDNISCANAPDGKTLQRYEIKSGNTFPSGKSYTDELQNFANWFTYYRKRKLMLASSAGLVLDSLSGMNLGLVQFNSRSPVTMVDSDSTTASTNAKVIKAKFYGNPSSGGTPARETLNYIGNQFKTRAGTASISTSSTSPIVTYSCQKNASFLMTDGFANATIVNPPTYTSATYGAAKPFATTFPGTLADIGLSFYTNTITGTGLTAGMVPATDPTPSNPQNDGNSNLHMNTYAMTLGAKGTLWPAITNAFTASVTWPNPSVDRSPTAVDDLWHATINGRGQMFTASTPQETAQSISAALSNILSSSGSQAAVAFSTVNLRNDEAIGYVGSYTPIGWAGDVSAYPVDLSTGALMTGKKTWSADSLLQTRDFTTRAMAVSNGTTAKSLSDSGIWSVLNTAGRIPGTVADFTSYVRGNRTLENSTYPYRVRTGLIGPVVNSEPVSWLADKVVYAASNDGFLHAFDKTLGTELWAFAPSFVQGSIADISKLGAAYSSVLDGTPVVAKVGTGQTVLVGGRGTAGPGFYALDVTNPLGGGTQTDASVAARFLWEFPNPSTPSSVVSSLGTATGKPIIANTTKWGWVALLTSGYNSYNGTLDGKGRLFVLSATTGELLDTITTPAGGAGATGVTESGLSQVSGFSEIDGTVRNVYGGDLLGNVWKFDITNSSVTRLATLTNASNAVLPVTSAPELATVTSATSNGANRRMVFVGTGRMLGTSDFSDTSVNSFFALWDTGTEINPNYVSTTPSSNVRNFLAPRKITVDATTGNRTATGVVPTGDPLATCTGPTKVWTANGCVTKEAVDWTTQRGWYVDLPAGEKANTDPSIAVGIVSWTTNKPSLTSCTSSSALYFADEDSGLQLPDAVFKGAPPVYGKGFSTTLTSRPVITRLPSGIISITTHQSDNTTRNITLDIGSKGESQVTVKKGKVAWRQVLQ